MVQIKQNRNSGGNRYPKKSFSELGENFKRQYFSENFTELLNMSKTKDLNAILSSIEKFVSEEGRFLSTSQLRNIYDKAKKASNENELKLIRPNLAYIAGRGNDKDTGLLAFIDLMIKEVNSSQKVKEFQTFFESVVAYHKFYGKQ